MRFSALLLMLSEVRPSNRLHPLQKKNEHFWPLKPAAH
jgi:hypothetical protein